MILLRPPVPLIAAGILVFFTFSTASAQVPSGAVLAVNQATSVVGFTIVGSSLFTKIKRDGQFRDFTGRVSYDPARPASTDVDLTVYTASVDMHDADNTRLLKSGEFFDVQRFPTMHFAGSATGAKPDGMFSMTGDMTIRGITKRMTIPVSLRQMAGDLSSAVFETTFPIDRTEFGLNGVPRWNGLRVSISKNVQIHLAIVTALNTPQLAR
jgi:polyisoprenoid-binding protein YceI